MKYKIITTFKPGDWDKYAKRMVQSVLDNWPNADVTVYYQQPHMPDFNENITWFDIDKANPNLHKFREKYKSDPVAMGKLNEIPGGVRRSPRLKTEGGKDAFKESYFISDLKKIRIEKDDGSEIPIREKEIPLLTEEPSKKNS